jgi:hypothetical protein
VKNDFFSLKTQKSWLQKPWLAKSPEAKSEGISFTMKKPFLYVSKAIGQSLRYSENFPELVRTAPPLNKNEKRLGVVAYTCDSCHLGAGGRSSN